MSFSIKQISVDVCGKEAELFLIEGSISFLEEDKAVQEIDKFFSILVAKKKFSGGMALLKSQSHLPLAATATITSYLNEHFPIVMCYNKKIDVYIITRSKNSSYVPGTYILEKKVKQC